jgi:enamine deaminase RidA (YjgF/YER057c/UK114 family)
MTRHQLINPESLGAPKGYSHGVLAREGRLLFVAGMVGWDHEAQFGSDRFSSQFEQALKNVVAVVREAGGEPADVCRFTVYVTDKKLYLEDLKEIGAAYQRVMGKHYPAMALLEVSALVEDRALVEIEATAVV